MPSMRAFFFCLVETQKTANFRDWENFSSTQTEVIFLVAILPSGFLSYNTMEILVLANRFSQTPEK
jgi:hypothetical protein